MKSVYRYTVFVYLMLTSMQGWAQETVLETAAPPRLIIKARAKKDAIYLRWGVNDKLAWKYGNQYGYIIERATIFRDGEPLVESEKTILTGGAIKPRPLPQWESLIENNDMAAVAAQAIYGESFSVNNGDESLLMKVINESGELEQRFGFSMFAVDQDFIAAEYSGLGFIDTDVKANEQYLYNIKMAVPEEILKIDETGLRISPSELNLLPKPFDFTGYYYNNAFVLIWEYDALLNFYTAYDLEKSEDGINFTKVNKTPITKLAVTETSGISFTDSIPQYGKKYWYRILGKTLFNESSPPSDTISVIAFKELLVGPEFKNNELLSDKKVILQWGFAEDEAWKLTGFDVLRSDRAIGPYKIIKENLDRDKRKYQYSEVKDINYFKIRAKGISGDYQDSSPAMVQPIDSVPPLPPSGLKGTIDTLGIVRLSWNKNTELDLKGYTVLRADRPRQEFTRLTKGEIRENKYLDTINLKTFNKNVFYKLIASDFRYNESQPSKIIVLERPTKIPPSSPIFSAYEVQGDTIHLKWVPSSSDNITKQIIYRKEINQDPENQWENIFETSDTNLSEFKNVNTVPNTKYTYTITALNQNGLESNPSPPISVTTQKRLLRPEVKGLYANVNREGKFIQLSWRYKEANIMEIQVFRKDENTEFSLYQVFAPKRKQFIDAQLIPNTVYTYGLKAVFRDGSVSEWNEIEVKY